MRRSRCNGDPRSPDPARSCRAGFSGSCSSRGRPRHRDQYLRAVAELDNVRKRAQRDVENASRYGLEKFAVELLPVKDSLERAVSNAGTRRTRRAWRRARRRP